MDHDATILDRSLALMTLGCVLCLCASTAQGQGNGSRGSYRSPSRHASPTRPPGHDRPTPNYRPAARHQPNPNDRDPGYQPDRKQRPDHNPRDRSYRPRRDYGRKHDYSGRPGQSDRSNVGVGIYLDPLDPGWGNYDGNRAVGSASAAWLHYAAPLPGFERHQVWTTEELTTGPSGAAQGDSGVTSDQSPEDTDVLLQAPAPPAEQLPPPRT